LERLTIACVQQRMRLPQTIDEYKDDLRRFMRIAERKNARLLIFPELAGAMLMPPLLGDFHSSLLKRADRGRRTQATAWQKLTGSVAGYAATLLQADMRQSIAALLDVAAADMFDVYADTFSSLAREASMTIIAPSAYLPDPVDGVIRNIAGVFGVNGEALGWQSKVVLHPADTNVAQPGDSWDVIQTEIGRLGLMLGGDVLFPEVGRVLAYQGAEMLISQAAAADLLLYNKVRAGLLARMQDNQLFGASSFLVGPNELLGGRGDAFVGKSAIVAPQELTPRANGVLVEMGNTRSEGVITAEWDFGALRELWDTSDTPVRQQMPLEQVGPMLTHLYDRLQQLPRVSKARELPEPSAASQLSTDANTHATAGAQADEGMQDLDDLPVLSSVSSRWPLPKRAEQVLALAEDPADRADVQTLAQADAIPDEARREAEEETEEIDALDSGGPDASAGRR